MIEVADPRRGKSTRDPVLPINPWKCTRSCGEREHVLFPSFRGLPESCTPNYLSKKKEIRKERCSNALTAAESVMSNAYPWFPEG